MRRIGLATLLTATLIGTMTTAQADWETKTTADSTASVRLAFVREILEHRAEVRAAIRHRREVRQQRREEAAAVVVAEEPTQAPGPMSYSASSTAYRISEAEAADAMRVAGFPESVIPYFISTIIPRESGFCPTAVYPGHCGDVSLMVPGGAACSLFQLYHCPGPQVADPYVAARYAYAKYAASGLTPWGM